ETANPAVLAVFVPEGRIDVPGFIERGDEFVAMARRARRKSFGTGKIEPNALEHMWQLGHESLLTVRPVAVGFSADGDKSALTSPNLRAPCRRAHIPVRAPPNARMTTTLTYLAVAAAGFCAFLNLYAPQSLLPLLASEFGVGAALISTIMTAGTLAIALTAPFTGVVADVLGRKRVISVAMFAVVIPTALIAFAQ